MWSKASLICHHLTNQAPGSGVGVAAEFCIFTSTPGTAHSVHTEVENYYLIGLSTNIESPIWPDVDASLYKNHLRAGRGGSRL